MNRFRVRPFVRLCLAIAALLTAWPWAHRTRIAYEWCFGAQAEHIITSLGKGARVIVIGTFRTRAWTAADGAERTKLEIVADEIGPSLRWATTEVTKTSA